MKHILILVVVCIACTITLSAQDSQPLLIAQKGIITMDHGANGTQNEQWCASDIPDGVSGIFAPDGSAIAYRVNPPEWEEAIRRTGIPVSHGLTDIIICQPDIETDIHIGQPENISIYVPDVDDVYIKRSPVTWSPDSSQIAWTEIAAGAGDMPELVILTIETGETIRQAFPNIIQTVRTWAPNILWTDFGFVSVGVDGYDEYFVLFDAGTGEFLRVDLPEDLQSENPLLPIGHVFPIASDDPGAKIIAFRIGGGGWYTVDYVSGEVLPFPENQYVQVFNIDNPTGNGLLYVDIAGRISILPVFPHDMPDTVRDDSLLPPSGITSAKQVAVAAEGGVAWDSHDVVVIILNNGAQPYFFEDFQSRELSLWWGTVAYRIVHLESFFF